MSNYSVDGLVEFLERAASKGWMNPTTAKSQISACGRVLGVLDESERADVRKIDIDDAINRFHNTDGGVSANSLNTYKSRIQKAIKHFTDYRTNPTGWRMPGSKPVAGSRAKAPTRQHEQEFKSGKLERQARLPHIASQKADVDLFTYPFPLREGVTVEICNLPRDFTEAEHQRLSSFLEALCVDKGQKKSPRPDSKAGGE